MAEEIELKPMLPDRATIGDLYDPAMVITDQAEADKYFELLIERDLRMRPGATRAEAERVERQNLGYYAGYFDEQTRRRVEALFKTAHPFFGPVAINGVPTADTAYNIGRAIGHALPLGRARR